MKTLTLEQVREAGLPAQVFALLHFDGAVVSVRRPGQSDIMGWSYNGRTWVVEFTDGKLLATQEPELHRETYNHVTGERWTIDDFAPLSGWHHLPGCDCELCCG